MPALPTPAPVLYRGLELLTLAPTRIDDADRRTRLALPAAPFAGASGAPVWRGSAAPALPAAETFALTWLCQGRAALAALDAFFARRAGRLRACWLPTYRQDAAVDVYGPTPSARVLGTGYAAAFPALAGRAGVAGGGDDWIAFPPSANGRAGAGYAFRTTVALPQPDDTTALDVDLRLTPVRGTAEGWLWGRLVVARLAEDRVATRFLHGGLAVVEASFVTTVD